MAVLDQNGLQGFLGGAAIGFGFFGAVGVAEAPAPPSPAPPGIKWPTVPEALLEPVLPRWWVVPVQVELALAVEADTGLLHRLEVELDSVVALRLDVRGRTQADLEPLPLPQSHAWRSTVPLQVVGAAAFDFWVWPRPQRAVALLALVEIAGVTGEVVVTRGVDMRTAVMVQEEEDVLLTLSGLW